MFAAIVLLGPRVGIILWWIARPALWNTAFTSVLWPILGFIFTPWLTLMYVAVSPGGNIQGFDWVWLGLALLADIASYGGGAYTGKDRMPGRGQPAAV